MVLCDMKCDVAGPLSARDVCFPMSNLIPRHGCTREGGSCDNTPLQEGGRILQKGVKPLLHTFSKPLLRSLPRTFANKQCANWVHCGKRGSQKSTFLGDSLLFIWEVIFSGARVLWAFHYGTRFNLIEFNSLTNTVVSKTITDRHLCWGQLIPTTDTEWRCQKN